MKLKITLVSLTFAYLLLASNSWANDDLVVRHQGMPHDALYDICFKGGQGVAVGAFGAMLMSNDGGVSWESSEQLQSKTALLGIECLPDKTIVVGQEGAIYLEMDGDWRQVSTPTDQRLFSVAMTGEGLGIAVGGFGTVLRTLDGGVTWEVIPLNWEEILNDFLEPHIYDVSISKNGVITIVGEFELVMQSHDKGESWTVANKGDASLFALSLNETGTGFAVGQNGTVIKTSDTGLSWNTVNAGGTGILLDVWSGHGEVAVIGIRQMLRSSDDGVSWTPVVSGDIQESWYQGIGVATFSESTDADGSNVTLVEEKAYMVGHAGRIIEFR
jgi:photosystem II stability/assembly factor-like uncharacterized protein